MSFFTRLFFALLALSLWAAAPAWACDGMVAPGVTVGSHQMSAQPVSHPSALADTAGVSTPAAGHATSCSDCSSCAFCACLCVGLTRPQTGSWLGANTVGPPVWTAAPMASRIAAPELKPPRI